MYPADLRRRNTKQHELQTIFLCEIMQLTAFICVICAICERIFTQEYSSYHQRKYPNVSRWFTQAPPNKSNNLNEILCEIMQLCCIPLRNLRYLRENIHIRVLKQSPKKPQCIPQIYADETQNHTNCKLSFSTTSESCIFQQNTCIVMKNLLPLHH